MGKINKKLADQKAQVFKKTTSKFPPKSKEIKKEKVNLAKSVKQVAKAQLVNKSKPPKVVNISTKEEKLPVKSQKNNQFVKPIQKVGSEEKVPIKSKKLVNQNQIKAGAEALLSWLSKDSKQKKLFTESQPIFLQLVCIKVPQCPRRTMRIPLPNPLTTPTGDVCLFVPDLHKGRKTDHEPTIQHYEDLLRSKGVKNIKAIIPMRQVKTEYDQFELRRKLNSLYEHFLVDAKIAKHLNKKLGKIFINTQKVPTPINLADEDLKSTISKALTKTPLHLHPDGDTYMVQIGHTQQKSTQIIQNISAVITYLANKYPGGFGNIRSLHVRGETTPSIPIYISLKPNSEVPVPKMKPKRPAAFKPVEGALTTANDQKVRVLPTGEVRIVKPVTAKKVEKKTQLKLKIKNKKNAMKEKVKTTPEAKKKQKKQKEQKEESDSEDDVINNAEAEYLTQYSSTIINNKKQNKSKNKFNKKAKK